MVNPIQDVNRIQNLIRPRPPAQASTCKKIVIVVAIILSAPILWNYVFYKLNENREWVPLSNMETFQRLSNLRGFFPP